MRELLKKAVRCTKFLQRLYGAFLYVKGQYHWRKGAFYRALDALARACRRIPSPDVTRAHAGRMERALASLCFEGGALLLHRKNPLLPDYQAGREAAACRRRLARRPFAD